MNTRKNTRPFQASCERAALKAIANRFALFFLLITSLSSPSLGSCLHDLQVANPGTPIYVVSGTMGGGAIAPNASAILTAFSGNPSNKIFLFDGVVTINASITFTNCTIYFTAGSSISMTANTLRFAHCDLLAGCGTMWSGINAVAGVGGCTVQLDFCNISDMTDGVYVDGGLLEANDNTFFDNYISIDLVQAHTSTIIVTNSFSTVNFLLPPYSGDRAEIGIRATDCAHLKIGDGLSMGNGNTFYKLHGGIVIDNNADNALIDIVDATFDDIIGETGTNPYNSYRGAAIFGTSTVTPASGLFVSVGSTDITALASNSHINSRPSKSHFWAGRCYKQI